MDSKAHLQLQTYNFSEEIYYKLIRIIEKHEDINLELLTDLLNVIKYLVEDRKEILTEKEEIIRIFTEKKKKPV